MTGKVKYSSDFKYYIIYKPYLVLSQFTDSSGKATLADFYNFGKDVYPVGRLDYDSEGLLILTNDNYLKTQLLDPKNEHKRIYYAQIEGKITEQAIKNLKNGIEISVNGAKYITKPCEAKAMLTLPDIPERNPPVRYRKNIPDSWIELILTEGKNRQVRKMTAGAGFPTLRLIRSAIEDLELNKLKPGQVIQISKNTIYRLVKVKNIF
jgi:23S rRNA pseudouridine2457 synthase